MKLRLRDDRNQLTDRNKNAAETSAAFSVPYNLPHVSVEVNLIPVDDKTYRIIYSTFDYCKDQ